MITNRLRFFLLSLAMLTSAAACDRAPPPKPEVDLKCSKLGLGEHAGNLKDPCDGAAKSLPVPLSAKWTGKIEMTASAAFTVTNTGDKPIHAASAAAYYYDKADKPIEAEVWGKKARVAKVDGSLFTLEPGETKELRFGWRKQDVPTEIAKIQVVFTTWCTGKAGDAANEICVSVGEAAEQRAATP